MSYRHHRTEKCRQPATTASAVGGRAARACDGCLRRRARWYCAADDAFLCQVCDSSVHSANPVARRHERLRVKGCSSGRGGVLVAPAWYHGFRRKARTPRAHHHARLVVPEMDTSAADEEEEEEAEEGKLLYRVPIFDPDLSFRSPTASHHLKLPPPPPKTGHGVSFIPYEAEVAEFSADMESLLGRGLEGGESCCMGELGLVDAAEGGGQLAEVTPEVRDCGRDGEIEFEKKVDLSWVTLDLDLGYGSPATGEEEEKPEAAAESGKNMPGGLALRLDYDAVEAAWSARGQSPWTSGERPLLRPEQFLTECLGMWSGGRREMVGGWIHAADVGREARVSRYREKRRTRLFSKKIRYEVRKLNADKRPRMKGRFVKRTSFPAANAGAGAVAFPF